MEKRLTILDSGLDLVERRPACGHPRRPSWMRNSERMVTYVSSTSFTSLENSRYLSPGIAAGSMLEVGDRLRAPHMGLAALAEGIVAADVEQTPRSTGELPKASM